MRKYFIFNHKPTLLGSKTMVEVYSFADILHLLSLAGIKVEYARFMPFTIKVTGMNYEWRDGAYYIVGMCNGKVKCIGVTNFRE